MTDSSNPFNNVLGGETTNEEISFGNAEPADVSNNDTVQPPSVEGLSDNVTMQNQNHDFNFTPSQDPLTPTENPFSRGSIGSREDNKSTKYKIIDLYWIINQKLYQQKQLESNEASLLTIGFNADFTNMRIILRRDMGGAFTPKSIILGNTKMLSGVNLFPETCYEILSKLSKPGKIFTFERVISNDNNWTPNRGLIEITQNGTIIINIEDNRDNQVYVIELSGFQANMFINACKFMTDGGAFNLAMEAQFRK